MILIIIWLCLHLISLLCFIHLTCDTLCSFLWSVSFRLLITTALHIYLFTELFMLSRVFFSMRQVISGNLGSSVESRSIADLPYLVSPLFGWFWNLCWMFGIYVGYFTSFYFPLDLWWDFVMFKSWCSWLMLFMKSSACVLFFVCSDMSP